MAMMRKEIDFFSSNCGPSCDSQNRNDGLKPLVRAHGYYRRAQSKSREDMYPDGKRLGCAARIIEGIFVGIMFRWQESCYIEELLQR